MIVRVVKYFLPRVVSLENVTGLLSSKHRKHLQELVRRFLELGYSVLVFTVDASHYGDPQERERVIIFASRIDHRLPEVPAATHGPGLEPVASVKKAIGDLEDVEPAHRRRRVPTADGKNALFVHWRDGRNRPKSDEDIMQLEAGCPANTVLPRNYIEHYSQSRPLSVQERARLMGIDDSFQFFGTVPQVCDMIGNGVPVNLSKALGESIKNSFLYSPVQSEMTSLAKNIWEDMQLP